MQRYFFNPFSVFLLLFLILALIIMLPLLFLGIIGGALHKLGFETWQVIFLVVAMIVGSFINIPVTRIKNEYSTVRVPHGHLMSKMYKVPEFSSETTVAINLGGAVIPVLVSLVLLLKIAFIPGSTLILSSALIGILIVTIVVHLSAKPVQGLGIATPLLIPPLCALICGIVLSWGIPLAAPVIAYVAGTIGTLVGADILNLKKLGELGAPVASIGGAGTFDGIFLTGIIAAFLA
ncbi:DUF1614 domain-containing protein [Methanoplanus sp. FWC-SCC4]|uniref:DUF1614 domain-containing protein n=1 Tax=Methanochimaera problematica TaxID=2609417 RepID=A0AA97I4X8_9EURY|nr:DUF1614 domain-containing protein [Methanoplanus sp. FWC-SCC4]WOF16846.1 DUF1614 domain-containing protein [Methanoplanus sp. FWC-SCC4]